MGVRLVVRRLTNGLLTTLRLGSAVGHRPHTPTTTPFQYKDLCALIGSRRASSLGLTENPGSRDRLARSPSKRKYSCQTSCHHGYRDLWFDHLPPCSLYWGTGCWALIFWMSSLQLRQTLVSADHRVERGETETTKNVMQDSTWYSEKCEASQTSTPRARLQYC